MTRINVVPVEELCDQPTECALTINRARVNNRMPVKSRWSKKMKIEMGKKMKIEMGKKYRTRDGKKVRVLCTDRGHTTFTVVVLLDNQSTAVYTSEGKFSGPLIDSPYDLFESGEWDDFKVDDKVIVWDDDNVDHPVRRHFAGVSSIGMPMTFLDGKTSYTSFEVDGAMTRWDNCIKWEEVK